MARTKSKTRRKKKGASKRSSRARSTGGRSTKAKRTPARAKAKTKRRGQKSARTTRSGARKQARGGARTKTGTSRRKRAAQSEAQTPDIYGEGNYTASRNFRRAETDFVRRHKRNIPKMGKEAEAALEGPEGSELNEAEEEAKSHAAGEEE